MPKQPRSLINGTIIDGCFRVLDFLGEGGMGIVYKVEHTQLNKIFALKILKTSQLTEAHWQRFRNEAQAIARLDHRNIVKIYDMNQTSNGRPFYTMDFLTGVSLADYLKEHKVMALNQALHVFRQVCSGLAYAHSRGIIHRDIKPANIMLFLDEKTQLFQVQIVDFGIAKLVDDDGHTIQSQTKPGEVIGSPLYMSPEQCTGRKLDARSDMYSLGATMFKALTGNTPFRGQTAIETTMMHETDTPPLLNSVSAAFQYPPRLESVIDKMLSKSPEKRFQSLAEVENELQKLQSKIAQASPVVSSAEQSKGHEDDDQDDLTETNSVTGTGEQAIRHKHHNIKLTLIAVFAVIAIGLTIAMLIALPKYLAVRTLQPVSNLAKIDSAFSNLSDMSNYGPEVVEAAGQKRSKGAGILIEAKDPTPEIQAFLQVPFKLFSHKKALPDGSSEIEFQFPQKFSVGTFAASDNPGRILDARGSHSVAAGAGVRFVANELVGEYPQLLTYFSPTDLVQLKIPKAAERSTKLIANIARLQSLESLELPDCQLKDSDLKTLEPLIKLRTLNISRCPIAGDALAGSALLAHLCDLNIERMKNVGPVIDSMGSTTRQICLNYCVLSRDDLRKLATLSNLSVLNLKGCNISDQDFSALAGMKKLTSLCIEECSQLTAKSIPTIKTFKNLQVLYPPPKLKNETATQILKSALPRLEVQ